MMLTTVRVEIWPLVADEFGIWLASGRDAWRLPLPLAADITMQAEVDEHLDWQDHQRRAVFPDADPSVPVMTHSTSWRQAESSVIHTWVAVMDCPGPARGAWPNALPVGVGLAQVVGKPAPHAPTESPIPRLSDVLYHGLRHLAFLANTDRAVRASFGPNWVRHLSDLSPVLAGLYLGEEDQNRAA